MRNRIIALLLACVMTVSLLPVSALAVEPSDTAAAQEATVITTAEEFAAMKPDGAYRLGADIAVDVPYDKTFTGSLDGAYHSVTLALHVTADDTAASTGRADDTAAASSCLSRSISSRLPCVRQRRCRSGLSQPVWRSTSLPGR